MNAQESKNIQGFINRHIENGAGSIKTWQENLENPELWENLKGHCLIEAARVAVLSDLLKIEEKTKKNAISAALLHDGHKPQEILAIQKEITKGGSGRAASVATTKKYLEYLIKKKVSKKIIWLIEFAGGMPEALFSVQGILDSEIINNENIAALVINYVDAYTRNDEWVEPSTQYTNDVDRRVEKNKKNPNYNKIGEEIDYILKKHKLFKDFSSFESIVVICRKTEKKLSQLIKERSGIDIEPLKIPEEIDRRLKEKLGF